MKKMITILLQFFAIALYAQQPSQAEIDKMMKEAKDVMKQYGIDEKTLTGNKSTTSNTEPRKFPARQVKVLNSLPKKVLSAAELKQFMNTVHADLQRKLPAAKVKSATAIIQKLNTQYEKIAATGVAAWYNNSPAVAALLVSYASSKSTNVNTLNNSGAVLNLCGLESKAIPVLKYVLQQQPGNSTVLNNLGQAYAALGATDTAMRYLLGCMVKASNHPEACATAAYIEMEKGNIEKAIEYAERSLRSSYDGSLADWYKEKKKGANLWKLYKDKIPKKQYFDINDFIIPPNCRSWQQSPQLYPKQQAFIKKIDALVAVAQQETVMGAPLQSTNPADYIKWSQTLTGSKGGFEKMAIAIRGDMGDLYLQERGAALNAMMKKMYDMGVRQGNDAIAFEQKWGERTRNVKGEQLRQLLIQKCKERVEMDNSMFTERALVADHFKNEWYPKDVEYYNNYIFLATLINPTEVALKMDCANVRRTFLLWLKSYVSIIVNPNSKPDCSVYDAAGDDDTGSPIFKDADCPIDLEIPFVIGKINLDCKKFGIELGEGIIINYEKDFTNRNSTLAIGLGAGVSIPGIGDQSSFEAGAKEQFFITFDGDNQPIDGGLIFETGAGIPGVTGTSAGYTLGVNSGFSFDPGPLSGLLQ